MIEDVNKQGEQLTCEIQSLENGTVVEFPYIYYPGYKITINGESKSSLFLLQIKIVKKVD